MTVNVSWETAVTAEHVTSDMASIALHGVLKAGTDYNQSRGEPGGEVGCALSGQPKALCPGRGAGPGLWGQIEASPAWSH